MEFEDYFDDVDDELGLGCAQISVLIDYDADPGCAPSFNDPGYPPHIDIKYVSLRQIENDTGTINYDNLPPEKQQQIDKWIMVAVDRESIPRIEEHETDRLEDEGAYSDEG